MSRSSALAQLGELLDSQLTLCKTAERQSRVRRSTDFVCPYAAVLSSSFACGGKILESCLHGVGEEGQRARSGETEYVEIEEREEEVWVEL